MTKKQFEKLVLDIVNEYQKHLNLQDWDIGVVFRDHDHVENYAVAMENEIEISYLTSTVRVYPISKTMELRDIKQTIMHELCHIITEPQYSLCRGQVSPHLHPFVEEQREQETERIARIAMKGI